MKSDRRHDRWITSAGVLIEWYDFIVYGLLATTLQKAFFPVDSMQLGLILTFSTFAIGYLARPLGGLVIGRIGDRRGRRFALLLATSLMLIPLLTITVLPTYEQIGIAAPLLLILMRLTQGFSVGGEFTGALTRLSEVTDDTHRARSISLGAAMASSGILAASLVVLLTTITVGEESFEAGGWRIPFGIGFLACLVALILQLRLPETQAFEQVRSAGVSRSPLREVVRRYPWQFLALIALAAWSSITIYTLVTWLPSYLETMVGTSMSFSQATVVIASTVYVITILPIARVVDRVGCRPVMIVTAGLYLIATVPIVALFGGGMTIGIVIGIVILGVLQAALDASATTELTQLVPNAVRYTAMGVGYSIGAMIGSLAPVVEQTAVAATGSLWVPAVILMGTAALALPLVLALPRIRLGGRAVPTSAA